MNRERSGGCLDAVRVERNRYFPGKFMNARDFAADTEYLLSRHRLQNRLALGWGVACGLDVHEDPRSACPNQLVVCPGIAIDCHGREIVIEEPVVFPLASLLEGSPELPCREDCAAHEPEPCRGRPEEERRAPEPEPAEERPKGREAPEQADQEQGLQAMLEAQAGKGGEGPETEPDPEAEAPPRRYLLCLRYVERCVEPVPVLVSSCGTKRSAKEPNRLLDGWRLCLEPYEDFSPECWPCEERPPESCPPKDRERCLCDPDACCPDCPCGECVPLALVTVRRGQKGAEIRVDDSGRRRIDRSPACLTQIEDLSWRHGGEMRLGELNSEEMGGGLHVWFTRPIREREHYGEARPGLGINEHTFTVSVGSSIAEMRAIDACELDVRCGGREAFFKFHTSFLESCEKNDRIVRVTLRCDFIEDRDGVPVDGDHLSGRLPTGNGVQGGTFESWFVVRKGTLEVKS